MPELLCLGQAHNSSTPSSAAGKIFFKSATGYGTSYGTTDVLMLFETQDFAPLGPLGRLVGRRLHLMVEYGGSIVIRVTPITDFNDFSSSQDFNLPAPVGGRARKVVDVSFAKACTWVRCRIQVLSRDGLFWLQDVKLAYLPLSSAYEQIAGPDV